MVLEKVDKRNKKDKQTLKKRDEKQNKVQVI